MPKVAVEELAARRGAILAAARRAFARHGYEGATVRVLEAETGLSRGAIFHHFRDKEALFLALAEDDAARTADRVGEAGLVQVMRELREKDDGWLGVQLEVRRRLRTDPVFAEHWAERQAAVRSATVERLRRQRAAGVVRDDVGGPGGVVLGEREEQRLLVAEVVEDRAARQPGLGLEHAHGRALVAVPGEGPAGGGEDLAATGRELVVRDLGHAASLPANRTSVLWVLGPCQDRPAGAPSAPGG